MRHFVEQFAGVIQAAAFGIGIDQTVLDEDFRGKLALDDAGVHLARVSQRS